MPRHDGRRGMQLAASMHACMRARRYRVLECSCHMYDGDQLRVLTLEVRRH